jgi:hypothetical protein
LLLLFSHGPFIQVGAFIGFESFTIFSFHERHAKLIDPIAFAALFSIKNDGAWHIQVRFIKRH